MKKTKHGSYIIEKKDVKSLSEVDKKIKTSEYKFSNKEVMEMAREELHIDLPIRKDKKEKMDYIIEEIKSENINNNTISKARLYYLSKMI